MKAYIKAISYYLPERIVTNEELLQEFPEWSVDKVAAKVGVSERHLAAPDGAYPRMLPEFRRWSHRS